MGGTGRTMLVRIPVVEVNKVKGTLTEKIVIKRKSFRPRSNKAVKSYVKNYKLRFVRNVFFLALLAGTMIMTSCNPSRRVASGKGGVNSPMCYEENKDFQVNTKTSTKLIEGYNSAACPGEHRQHQKTSNYKGK